jgi:hypothetical protein
MTWSLIWVPLAVVALASLVGWALARWLSPALALLVVLLLGVGAMAMVVAAVIQQGESGLVLAVWVTGVILPAAIGIGIGAMMAMRGR